MKKTYRKDICVDCKIRPQMSNGRTKDGRQRFKIRCYNCHFKLNPQRSKPYLAYKDNKCARCGFVAIHSCQLDVDHIDGNHQNNAISNLQTLCANCHRLKTYLNKDWENKIPLSI